MIASARKPHLLVPVLVVALLVGRSFGPVEPGDAGAATEGAQGATVRDHGHGEHGDEEDDAKSGEEAHGSAADNGSDHHGEGEPGAGEHGGHGHGEGENEDLVQVTPEQRQRFGITLATAGPGTIDTFTELPGQVRPNGDKLAHIVARFPGVVREVRKTIGDSVKAGDVLATVESSTSLSPYTLTTAIEGVIIDKHLTQGEAIDAAKGAFLVANLNDVWIDLAVYQKDLDKVTRGQTVRISAGKEIPAAEGPISYLTPTVDAPTRTATARVVLPNTDGRWRPGMFVTGRVIAPVQARLVVPLTAIQTVGGSPVVFVDTPKGFEPRPVILGTRGESQVAVESGLEADEHYAATNTFLLKAELGKGEAEHEH